MIIEEDEIENNQLKLFMSSELILISFVGTGLISGLLGGLLGLGGGIVTVPFLYYFFLYSGQYEEKFMQIAIGTSLAASFVTSAISTFFQMRKKAVQFSALKWIIGTLIIGCILGSFTAHYLKSEILSLIFGIMAICIGAYFLFLKLPKLSIASSTNWTLSLFAFSIGSLSSMLGIGGGSITFPILLGYGVPVTNAIATSSASTLITTAFGTLAYLYLAWNESSLPGTFGYIDVSAWLTISISSALTSPIGVKLSHILPTSHIKRVFGGCLILIGLSMMIF